MTTDIVMPNMGFDTQAGRLIEWLKQPGDSVEKGEIIAIIESDKANVELESVADGIVLEQLWAEGDEVIVGTVIARIGSTEAGAIAQPASESTTSPVAQKVAVKASPVAQRLADEYDVDLSQIKGSGPQGRISRDDVETFLENRQDVVTPTNGKTIEASRALPKVRKAAREAGLDLKLITPSGPRNSISLADLQAYQAAPATPAVETSPRISPQMSSKVDEGQEVSLSRMRQTIGQRLQMSKQEAPHFYVMGEFDVEAVLLHLRQMAAPQPRINDLIQYLTVQTLQRVPELNATYDQEQLIQHKAINLAVAVAQKDGLITPVLLGAEQFSLTGLAAQSQALIQRTRDNRLQPNDLQQGTFTISNLGVIQQVERFTAIINPPQVAILAVGAIKPRPVVIDGGLHVRHTVYLSLSGDHRVVDGMHLGRFMAVFQEELDHFS